MKRLAATFSSLNNRNYRLYFFAQIISVSGTWMQKLGQAWLVFELTGSGTLLGVTAALQHLPTLVGGPWGGLLADRMNKRRILCWTQALAGFLALVLAALTLTGLVEVWMVMVLAFGLGTVHSLDKPARHTFVLEMVGKTQLTNAITLNNVVMNAGMLIGPALAGALIAWLGVGASFLINGLSYGAVIGALLIMRADQLERGTLAVRAKGQLREGLRYTRRTPALIGPIALMAVAGMLAFEWAVTLPLLAANVFDGDASTLGMMFTAMGLGAVLGGLGVASSVTSTPRSLVATGWLFAAMLCLVAFAPTLPLALLGLVFVGGTSIALRSVVNSLLQLLAAPEMRGRVISLLAVATSGTRPFGAPAIGWVGETFGARVALAVGGFGMAVATTLVLFYLRRRGIFLASSEQAADQVASSARSVGSPGVADSREVGHWSRSNGGHDGEDLPRGREEEGCRALPVGPGDHLSEVGRDLGISGEATRNWVRKASRDEGRLDDGGSTSAEKEQGLDGLLRSGIDHMPGTQAPHATEPDRPIQGPSTNQKTWPSGPSPCLAG